jgi:hypothetical protein
MPGTGNTACMRRAARGSTHRTKFAAWVLRAPWRVVCGVLAVEVRREAVETTGQKMAFGAAHYSGRDCLRRAAPGGIID